MSDVPQQSEMQQQIADQMEAARKSRLQEIAAEFDQAALDLQTVEATDSNPRLHEVVFREVFLPFFAGDADPPYKATIGHWINKVAGTSLQSVDVVDDKGQVLFTVPPIVDRHALTPIKTPQGVSSINNLVANAQNLSNVSPAQSEEYLRQELAARAEYMREDGHALEHAKTWNKIFARYGRPLITQVPGAKAETLGQEEKIEYDGFDEL